MPQSDEMMTTVQVMEYLQVSRMTLHRLVKKGALPTYKIGDRAVRFKRSDVEVFVESSRRPTDT